MEAAAHQMDASAMSLLDRLIGGAVARLPSRRQGVVLGGVGVDGLFVTSRAGERRFLWDEVERVVAASSAGYVGDTAFLVIAFADGETLVVPETDRHWSTLIDAVATRLPGTEPLAQWQLRLMAAPDLPLELYQR